MFISKRGVIVKQSMKLVNQNLYVTLCSVEHKRRYFEKSPSGFAVMQWKSMEFCVVLCISCFVFWSRKKVLLVKLNCTFSKATIPSDHKWSPRRHQCLLWTLTHHLTDWKFKITNGKSPHDSQKDPQEQRAHLTGRITAPHSSHAWSNEAESVWKGCWKWTSLQVTWPPLCRLRSFLLITGQLFLRYASLDTLLGV